MLKWSAPFCLNFDRDQALSTYPIKKAVRNGFGFLSDRPSHGGKKTDHARPYLIAAGILAILLGAVVASGGNAQVAVAGSICVGALLVMLTLTFNSTIPQLLLVVTVSLVFLLPLVHKVSGVILYGYFQAAVMALGVLGLPRLWQTVRGSAALRWSAAAFAGFLLLAAISTFHVSRSILSAALYQIASDIKFPMALTFGLYLASKADAAALLDRAIPVFIAVSVVFILFQWSAPGAYMSAFRGAAPLEPAFLFQLSRATSIFHHSSLLAAVATMLALHCAAKCFVDGRRAGVAWLNCAGLVLLLLVSMQRQEIFAFVLVCAGLYLAAGRKIGKRMMIAIVLSVAALVVFVALFGKSFSDEALLWGIGSRHAPNHPRAQLYVGALQIAKTYFPFGSGLGTFGGAGAANYDLSMFYKLGFGNYWWFRKEDFLLDTYWPNSLAEAGYIGALLLFLHYLLFLVHAVRRVLVSQSAQVKSAWLCVAGSFSWVLMVSPTSPGFQEMGLIFLPALMFGIAVAAEKKASSHA